LSRTSRGSRHSGVWAYAGTPAAVTAVNTDVIIVSRVDCSEAVDDRPGPPTKWSHDTDTTISAVHSHHC